jgi:hypothetical protein
MKYKIAANVRQSGAIGMTYRHIFDIDTRENWRERWFSLYGNQWELHHFYGEPVANEELADRADKYYG